MRPPVTHMIDNAQFTLCGIDRLKPRRQDRLLVTIPEGAALSSATCRNCHRVDQLSLTHAHRRHLTWCEGKGLDPVTLEPIERAPSHV